jgi:WD40 repeat protein
MAQRTLKHHTGVVTCVAFSPDGAVLASGSYDKSVVLVDTGLASKQLLSGKIIHCLTHHSSVVTCLAFSPNVDPLRGGGKLASGSADNTVVLVDPGPGKVLHTLSHHTNTVQCVAFSPDGGVLASGSHDKSIVLVSARSGEILHKCMHHSREVNCLAFSPDGGVLASGSADATVVLFDTGTGNVMHKLEHHTMSVLCLAFSPNGGLLASGSADSCVMVIDAGVGSHKFMFGTLARRGVMNKVLCTISQHSLSVRCLAFSPDGGVLASGSYDKIVVLVDPSSGKVLHKLTHHTAHVNGLAFSPDGSVLVSGAGDNMVVAVRNKELENRKAQIAAVISDDLKLLGKRVKLSGMLDSRAMGMLCELQRRGTPKVTMPVWITHLDQLPHEAISTIAIQHDIRSSLEAEYNATIASGSVTVADASKCLREHVEAVLCKPLQQLVDAAIADPKRNTTELSELTKRMLDASWWYPKAMVDPMQEVYTAKLLEEVRMADLDKLRRVAERQLDDDLKIYSAIHEKERHKPEYAELAAEVKKLELDIYSKQRTKPLQLVAGVACDVPLSVAQVKAHAADAHAAYVISTRLFVNSAE